ncbi:MAG: putative zinc-binding metallopeptidase [Pseudomonadota bacterium]
MKRFSCQSCGHPVFFDSDQCLACGARLAYDPVAMEMVSMGEEEWQERVCLNGREHGVCNWLRPADDSHPLCTGCQFNRYVPNQSRPENQQRWKRLEEGKKRLFFTLGQLGMPLVDGWRDPENGLLLDFIEDGRTSDEFAETFVSTGYLGGIITINVLEADSVARVAAREQLGERYRTVLGHLRHESGHFFWHRLNPGPDLKESFRELFGDEQRDYSRALADHYEQGPPDHWWEQHISAYASAHPVEDWAETWGHYLHIWDALDTAAAHGIVFRNPAEMTIWERIGEWRELSITLNEMNRSVGRGDAYPFVINSMVAQKLAFVDEVILRLQGFH